MVAANMLMLNMSGMRAVFAFLCVLLCAGAPATRAEPPDQAWLMPRAGQSLLLDIAAGADRWIAVGERGHVLISGDAGQWRQVAAPTRAMLTAVAVNERGLGFAVGHDATVIRTRDNGENWELVYSNPEEQAPFLDVVMAGDGEVVAVGAYGLYLQSGDGGDNWELRTLEPRELEQRDEADDGEEFFYDFHLNGIATAGDGRWYIAAEAGTVYRSDDRGESWLRLPSPYEGSFFGVLPLDGDDLLLFGLQGRLYRSDNAGKTWHRFETGTNATLTDATRLSDGSVLVVGHAGVILDRIDGKGNMERATLENRPALSAVQRLESGGVILAGEGGIRLRNTDRVQNQ